MSSVIVAPYSPEWPALFVSLSRELHTAFAPMEIAVDHIGSTAVPGLAAKPVIDILLGAGALADIESRIGPLTALGYTYVPRYERELPMRRYFVKTESLRVHLHAVEIDSPIWRQHLAFRDTLRTDSALRQAYETLKLRLAREFADDKSAYTEAKGTFIQSVLLDAGSVARQQPNQAHGHDHP